LHESPSILCYTNVAPLVKIYFNPLAPEFYI